MTTDLVEWLRAQLDDDEHEASTASPGPWLAATSNRRTDGIGVVGQLSKRGTGEAIAVFAGPNSTVRNADARHTARWDPPRVLAEVQAKRLLLDLHRGCDASCYILRVLALPYADRPGYEERAP